MTGILASPEFSVPRRAYAAKPHAPETHYKIDDLELASKLSFFLWNTIPDDELRDLASRRRAEQPDGAGAAGRTDAGGSARRDARQQLRLPVARHGSRLDEVEPDRAVFPYASGNGDPRSDYSPKSRYSRRAFSTRTAASLDLMTANHTYVNERVALLYGIESVKGDRFQRVELDRIRALGAARAKARF